MNMVTKVKTVALSESEAGMLQTLLVSEEKDYRRLLRLAVRQNRYLRRQDLARLEFNAGEWRRYLPAAETSRSRREGYLLELGERYGIDKQDLRMSALARSTRGTHGLALRQCLRAWEGTTGELVRQNSLNGLLARFCLDLVEDEAGLFYRGMHGPGDGYEASGGKAKGSTTGVIIRQA